jgi:hypothetical protein
MDGDIPKVELKLYSIMQGEQLGAKSISAMTSI